MSLIGPESVFILGAVLFGLAWFGFWADGNRLGKTTSGVLWVILGGLALSNFRLVPFESPVYDFVGAHMVPLAIPLLLFKADLRRILRDSGHMLITFSVAGTATVIGALVGFYLIDLGEMGPKAAGTYVGGWIGGAVNFVSVARALEMTPDEVSVAIGAQGVVSVMALATLIALPAFMLIRRFVPSSIMQETEHTVREELAEESPDSFRPTHAVGALALSFVICALADALATWADLAHYNILLVTLLAIAVANLLPQVLRRIEGDFTLGMIIMYLFFASVGCGTNTIAFVESALNLFFYSVVILVVHLLVVLAAARIFKIDLAEAVVASAAALLGPAPSAAIAAARGWTRLVTPGIMCGIFGYAIATFIGVAVAKLLT